MRKFVILLLSGCFFNTPVFSQTTLTAFSIAWKNQVADPTRNNEAAVRLPDFDGSFFNADLGVHTWFKKIDLPSDGEWSAAIASDTWTSVNSEEQNLLKKISTTTPLIHSEIGYEKGKPALLITVIPFRKNKLTGAFEKLESFSLSITKISSAHSAPSFRTYAANSVLSSGSWFKIAVTQTGVYKIDQAFLTAHGISTTEITPASIKVFGNGAGMLPEPNSTTRFDDLQELSIEVIGEADGTFDSGDYILFYGESQSQWHLNSSTNVFYHTINPYSDTTFYFLTFGGATGKRVADRASSASVPTDNVTTFDDHQFHEKDLYNLTNTGRTFYGESFEFNQTQTFSFTVPNIDASSPCKITRDVIARYPLSGTTSHSTMTTQAGSATLTPQIINSVDAGGLGASYALESVVANEAFTSSSSQIDVTMNYDKPTSDCSAWLSYLELFSSRNLAMNGNQMTFRDLNSVGTGKISKFNLSGVAAGYTVWDVTDPLNPENQLYNLSSPNLDFVLPTDSLHEFIGFFSAGFLQPAVMRPVVNQNLHGMNPVDLIIVTPESLRGEAERLAAFHVSHDHLTVVSPSLESIYNEFSGGAPDVTAIRDFVKMFYDRAAGDTSKMIHYLLLFGDGSFDTKNILSVNKNLVPAYETPSSLDPNNSMVTDDYFGFLDDNEGGYMGSSGYLLDIAIGRLTVRDNTDAATVVDKIIAYESSASTYGSWRNMICYIGDDEDSNAYSGDCEAYSIYIEANHPVYNIDKIYLDSYQQVSTSGGDRYPDVNIAIKNRIEAGALMIDYVGHGGPAGMAHERIMGVNDIVNYQNIDKLPLFLTATCDFTAYDNPNLFSAGENLLVSDKGGAIGLITTVRLVYEGDNDGFNMNYNKTVFAPYGGRMPRLGEVNMITKNTSTSTSGWGNRKFTLIGDPAMTLAYPEMKVATQTINGIDATVYSDTFRALDKITITGKLTDQAGNDLTSFNGIVYPTIFDKPSTYQTRGNDGGSTLSFQIRKNIIYKGKASVTNGQFSFTFIVPKDINYNVGLGKISYYSDDNDTIDANGYLFVKVGSVNPNPPVDMTGPDVNLFMNDDKFVFGGITDDHPIVFLKLIDSSGINTVGNGIGHDITGVLDGDEKNTFVMNDYYEANLNDYTRGEVHYPTYNLADGKHTLSVKAWDSYNNSAEDYTEFIVASSADMALSHVLNYPNPFTTQTEFMFETNKPGLPMHVKVQVFTVSGVLIKTLQTDLIPEGFRVDGLYWDGTDDFGDKIGKGVYIYKVSAESDDGSSAHEFERLVILK